MKQLGYEKPELLLLLHLLRDEEIQFGDDFKKLRTCE